MSCKILLNDLLYEVRSGVIYIHRPKLEIKPSYGISSEDYITSVKHYEEILSKKLRDDINIVLIPFRNILVNRLFLC